MLKIKIGVLVSGGGTNLQALIDAEKSNLIESGEIALVISDNSQAYALKRAEANGIPYVVVNEQGLDNRAFEEKVLDLINQNEIDLVVLAGFMKILSADFTEKLAGRIINIHPSLIPSFCGKGYYGLKVHEAALKYGVKITGATVHYVNEIPDGGQIILQKAVEVLEDDGPLTLQKRVMEQAEWVILPQAVELVSRKIQREKGEK